MVTKNAVFMRLWRFANAYLIIQKMKPVMAIQKLATLIPIAQFLDISIDAAVQDDEKNQTLLPIRL